MQSNDVDIDTEKNPKINMELQKIPNKQKNLEKEQSWRHHIS